jgi:beta-N-acetylhexosaminidase
MHLKNRSADTLKEVFFMKPARHDLPEGPQGRDITFIKTQKLQGVSATHITGTLDRDDFETLDTVETMSLSEEELGQLADTDKGRRVSKPEPIEAADTIQTTSISEKEVAKAIDSIDTPGTIEAVRSVEEEQNVLASMITRKLPVLSTFMDAPAMPSSIPSKVGIKRAHALLLISLLCILVLQSIYTGSMQFIGPQGWSYVLYGPPGTGGNSLLQTTNNQLHPRGAPSPGATPRQKLTPQQYINLIIKNMTLEQKIGQMMIIQFVGPTYSPDLSTMITQYNVGAVLIFASNGNIVDKAQLKGLIRQMQNDSPLPLAIAIDQEGGTVDRLKSLDGPRPSATAIGTTNDPHRALEAGIQDAADLSYYGINLNLAPVVDVNNVYNPQLYLRTYGNNPTIVTKMAGAYLQGLQQSGKVLGTLKHFPGLGDVASDPHVSVPYLSRTKSDLESIDWAPYRSLIRQGNVYAAMVTHEIVRAIDSSKPSSLSKKVVTGILRDELGFQGVIMTDSLTMEGITAYYSPGQAAALAIEAGSDLLMGASTPAGVATMSEGIKQDINAGNISIQRIDDSVRRILLLKYQMGLIQIPTN